MREETVAPSTHVQAVWRECLSIVEDHVQSPMWRRCLNEIEPLAIEGDRFVLQAGPFSHNILSEDVHFKSMITDELCDTLEVLTGRQYHLEWLPGPDSPPHSRSLRPGNGHRPLPAREPQEPLERRPPSREGGGAASAVASGLNPRYTFATFVEGSSNQLAHAAAKSVSNNPSQSYNPLFIYGGVGLGKTHLMQAIGHGILGRKKNARVMYVSTETFMNELIESISNKTTAEFREKYRGVDALLVDDIQFLMGRERTQEEFFHTFNYLHSNDRQIVLTSDRPPHELHPLEDRLRSRFTQGLIADIQSPDVETREAILRRKVAEQYQVNVPLDVIGFVAERFPSSIRDLEGAMIRVIAYASTHGRSIDMGLAGEALQQILPPDRGRTLTVRTIQEKVCEHFHIKLEELVGPRRDARFALPRQIAMYLAREMTNCSLKQIADEFNKKDHTTVLHAIHKVEDCLTDTSTRENVESIRHRLDDFKA